MFIISILCLQNLSSGIFIPFSFPLCNFFIFSIYNFSIILHTPQIYFIYVLYTYFFIFLRNDFFIISGRERIGYLYRIVLFQDIPINFRINRLCWTHPISRHGYITPTARRIITAFYMVSRLKIKNIFRWHTITVSSVCNWQCLTETISAGDCGIE